LANIDKLLVRPSTYAATKGSQDKEGRLYLYLTRTFSLLNGEFLQDDFVISAVRPSENADRRKSFAKCGDGKSRGTTDDFFVVDVPAGLVAQLNEICSKLSYE